MLLGACGAVQKILCSVLTQARKEQGRVSLPLVSSEEMKSSPGIYPELPGVGTRLRQPCVGIPHMPELGNPSELEADHLK